jgi:phosphohistidine phosphatase
MNLYIIRHADAGNPEKWRGDDADRPLSDLGHRQARALGEAFRHQSLTVDAVLASPLVRTRETAEGFLEAWGGVPAPQFSDLLAQGALKRRKLSKQIAGLGVENVAIIGHDPDLPEFLGWLLGAESEAVPLAKGGAALVVCKSPGKGGGQLGWVITPEWYLGGADRAMRNAE